MKFGKRKHPSGMLHSGTNCSMLEIKRIKLEDKSHFTNYEKICALSKPYDEHLRPSVLIKKRKN